MLASSVSMLPSVGAQPAGDAGRALALGREAMALYDRGQWEEAQGKFEEAERLAHSPVFVLYLARCARNAGDLAAAKSAYERLLKESLPAGAPSPWISAIESAKVELPELDERLQEPSVAPSASASASTAAAAPTASAAPSTTATSVLPAPSASLGVGHSASATAGPDRPPPGATRGSFVPGAVALGAGAVGIGVGIGLFAHALSIAHGIDERCPGGCPAERPSWNTAVSFADGATAAFVVGGAALAAGVVLMIVRPGGTPGAPPRALSVQPGLGTLRVGGAF